MTYRLLLLALLATGASAAPMTYTISGVGSGSWNSQPFTEASFTLTFNSDTGAIVHGTPCCSGADSTPAGTAATVTVSGFDPATLTGNQAIFLNRSEATAGVWHFDSPDYLTIATPAFANDDLTTAIPPTGGTTFSFVTPLPLSTGGSLYFNSVHDVKYSQQPGSPSGQVSTISVTPKDSTPGVNVTQIFTAVVADTAGASDVGGVDFQVINQLGSSYPCWLYFNASANTLTVYAHGAWAVSAPIGSAGSTLTGDDCTVDTKAATVSPSGNNLSLNLPIAFTSYGDGVHPWNINLAAQNQENQGTGYSQMGTVTLPGPPPAENFELSVDPGSQAIQPGGSADYKVTIAKIAGPDEAITFTGKAVGIDDGSVSITFNPATITGSGTTTMHVATTAEASPGTYQLEFTTKSPEISRTYGDMGGLVLYVANAPPVLTLKPNSGAGTSAQFVITWRDTDNPTPVSNLNFLVASTLDGRHSCWIYWDRSAPQGLYLADDDGASWTGFQTGKLSPGVHPVSNSQCTIDAANVVYNDDPPVAGGNHLGYKYLAIPISFAPGFAGAKSVYVRAANYSGFDTGYQALGAWTAQ